MSAPGERDDLLNAGISPRQRLERIEALLVNIDVKLDGKASAADVAELRAEVADHRDRLTRIEERNTSSETQRVAAMDRISELTTDVGVVGRKLAYATGTLASIMLIVNAITVYVLNN